jgi:gamma-glutamyltranspeptidase / glutathione hydrolase
MLRLLTALGASLCLAVVSGAAAQDRSQSRSMIVSKNGVVASEAVLASQVGVQILENGGNAIDAAVATNAMMGLIAPMNDGVGGDLFAIVYDAKSKKLYGMNGSGWSPKALTADYLLGKGMKTMPNNGIHSVTVPGTVDAWDMMLKRFGTKGFAELLAPAIQYSEEGFGVGEIVSVLWRDSTKTLSADEATAKTYLPNGRAPRVGEFFKNPDLAWTYRQIAEGGRDAFYKGEIAQKIVATFKHHGGTMALDDLAEFQSEWVDPISTTYRGWTVYELPPNGQGIAALEMLNIMESYPINTYGHNSVQALHAMIEAKKIAYADMIRYTADPKFAKIPTEGLKSKSFALQRAKLINASKAACDVGPGVPPETDRGTTYLSVVDKDGKMVSLIQSNYSSVGFGAGLAVGGAGFALQNRGGLFTLDKSHPNALVGRKRPVHTIIPAFMERGDIKIAFGIMGGWNQGQAHAQFVSNIVDFGMNPQGALDAPRFSKETFAGCDVNFEARISERTRNALTAMGHKIIMRGDFSVTRMGAGQAVQRDFATGVNFGASDPRKDGAALAGMNRGTPQQGGTNGRQASN